MINVFGNSNEGDQSAGLDGQGPLDRRARRPRRGQGDVQGLAAGRASGSARAPSSTCAGRGSASAASRPRDGRVADEPVRGVPFLTGSEEGRGPLFDVTQRAVRGRAARRPRASSPRATRSAIPGATSTDTYPAAVPLFVLRVGDRADHHRCPARPRSRSAAARAPRCSAAARGSGVRGRHGQRPRQRVHPVPHHARGVRPPALRGRLDDLRAGRVGGGHRLAGRAHRAACARASRAPKPAPVRPPQRGRARRRAVRQGRHGGDRDPTSRSTCRPAPRPCSCGRAGPRGLDTPPRPPLHRDPAPQPTAAGAGSPTTSGWRSSGPSTPTGAYSMHWQVPRAAQRRAATGSWSPPTSTGCARSAFAVDPRRRRPRSDPTTRPSLFAPITAR